MKSNDTYTDDLPIYRIVVIGSDNVGKTSLINRFSHKTVSDLKPTEYIDYTAMKYKSGDDYYKVQLVDTANSKTKGRRDLPRGPAHCITLVCDISSKKSREELPLWKSYIQRFFPETPIVIIGNKEDISSGGDVKEFKDIAQQLGLPYYIVSAKENLDTDFAFRNIMQVATQKNKSLASDEQIRPRPQEALQWERLGNHYSQRGFNEDSKDCLIKSFHCYLQAKAVDPQYSIPRTVEDNLLAGIEGQSNTAIEDVENIKPDTHYKTVEDKFKKDYSPSEYLARILVEEYDSKISKAAIILENNYIKKGAGFFKRYTHLEEVNSIIADIKSGKIKLFGEVLERLYEIAGKKGFNQSGALSKVLPQIEALEPVTIAKPKSESPSTSK